MGPLIGGSGREDVVFFKPEADAVGDQFFLEGQEHIQFVGIEGEDVLNPAVRTPAGECPFQDLSEPLVRDPFYELVQKDAFLFIVEAGYLQVLVAMLRHLHPERVVLVIGRDEKDLAGAPVEEIDQPRIRVLEGIDQIVPDDFNIARHTHHAHQRGAQCTVISDGKEKCGERGLLSIITSIFTSTRILAIVPGMHAIFIADAHLRGPEDANYRHLLRFLDTLPGTVESIFILGDFFEFWLGAPGISYPQYRPVLERLQRLVRNGVRLVYLEGNHDFHLGPVFTETLRAAVHPGPVALELDGRRLYLCHGDQVNRRDYGHRLLRAVLHSRLTCQLARLVPAAVPMAIADWLGSRSKAARPRRDARWEYDRIIREFAAERFREGVEVVVTGHFHRPFLEKNGNAVLLSLGDWISQFSYGEWHDGVLSLRTFLEGDQPSPNSER